MSTGSEPNVRTAPRVPNAGPVSHSTGVESLLARDVYEAMGSTPGGLSAGEAAQRLDTTGRNELREVGQRSLGSRLIGHFTHLMALLLWVGAGRRPARRVAPVERCDRAGQRHQWALQLLAGVQGREGDRRTSKAAARSGACRARRRGSARRRDRTRSGRPHAARRGRPHLRRRPRRRSHRAASRPVVADRRDDAGPQGQ